MKKSILFICFFLLIANVLQGKEVTVDWSSYFSNGLTNISVVRYDSVSDCIYIAGYTADTTGIATPGRHKSSFIPSTVPSAGSAPLITSWRTDAFIAKFTLDGVLVWGTYFGGDKMEAVSDMIIDSLGNLYLTGTTRSMTGIATAGTYQSVKTDDTTEHGFITKFDSTGHQIWGTYYGVSNFVKFDPSDTFAYPIYEIRLALDNSLNIYICGQTKVSDPSFATVGAHQAVYGGGNNDGFLMKFTNTGTRLWSTYFGGNKEDCIVDIKVGRDNYLYLVGITASGGLGTSGVYQTHPLSDDLSGFVSKFSLEGVRQWTSYISASGTTSPSYVPGVEIDAIDVDNEGNIYIVGESRCTNHIATPGTHQSTLSGTMGYKDIIIMKFNSAGQKIWGTYYGGSYADNVGNSAASFGRARIALDPYGESFVICGNTYSGTQIEYNCGYQGYTSTHGFISRFDTSGNIITGSYYDDAIQDFAELPRRNKNDGASIICIGRTGIDGLATPGAHKESKAGFMWSAFITKFSESCPLATPSISYSSPQLTIDGDYESYTWYHNGTAVSTGDSESYTPGADTTGYYYAKVSKCGCEYFTDTFYFDDIGIRQLDFERHFRLYPNPTTDQVRLEVLDASTNISAADIQVYNLLGQLQRVQISQPTATNFSIGMQQLSAGAYLLQVRNTKGIWTKQVVKW